MTDNLFDNFVLSKRSNIRTKNLAEYSKLCDKLLRGADEMKLISNGDYLKNCPCFNIYNRTNAKETSLDCSKFDDCIFDSIAITLDVFDSCMLYKVVGVYEGHAYDLIDFKFYFPDSKIVKQNKYLSDFLIHGKARRLQVVSGGKFNIGDFIVNLITYDVKHSDKFIVALGEYRITREDFRIDFFVPNGVKHLTYDDVFTLNSRKTIDNLVIDRRSKKIYTGWTAGNRKDKYIYVRMYQKQVEALDRGHAELYSDYLDYDGQVWRLEFEFLSRFTTARFDSGRGYNFFDEFYDHKLTKQIFEYLGVSEKNGYFSKPKKKIETPFNKLSLHRQQALITQTKNNVSKLHRGGVNPFIIVNQAIQESDPYYSDNQVLDNYFEMALYDCDGYNDLLKSIEKSKNTTKELYNRIYNSQIGVDI